MKVSETQVVLRQLTEKLDNHDVYVGTSGEPPNQFAYATLSSRSTAGLYAKVSSPGVNWFELEVTGGYYTGRTDDLASDALVREYLEEYLIAALAYLEGKWTTGTSRILRRPFVLIGVGDRAQKLHR